MMDGPRQIFTKYHKDVLAICYHYTWNLEEAEDITQEVFVKLLANFSSFDEEVNLKAWLYRVAINRCLDIKRRIARTKRRVLNWDARERIKLMRELIRDLPEDEKNFLVPHRQK